MSTLAAKDKLVQLKRDKLAAEMVAKGQAAFDRMIGNKLAETLGDQSSRLDYDIQSAGSERLGQLFTERYKAQQSLAAKIPSNPEGSISWVQSLNNFNNYLDNDIANKQLRTQYYNQASRDYRSNQAMEAGITRGQAATYQGQQALDAQFRSEGIYVTSEQDVRDHFQTYDRSLEIRGEAAFVSDILDVGMTLVMLAAGGAAIAATGAGGALVNGGARAYAGAQSGASWVVNGTANVVRTVAGNGLGIRGLQASASYYGGAIQTGSVFAADIIAGEGIGLASYGMMSLVAGRAAYTGLKNADFNLGRFVDGVNLQSPLRSQGLGSLGGNVKWKGIVTNNESFILSKNIDAWKDTFGKPGEGLATRLKDLPKWDPMRTKWARTMKEMRANGVPVRQDANLGPTIGVFGGDSLETGLWFRYQPDKMRSVDMLEEAVHWEQMKKGLLSKGYTPETLEVLAKRSIIDNYDLTPALKVELSDDLRRVQDGSYFDIWNGAQ